jgi:hypothetical protein
MANDNTPPKKGPQMATSAKVHPKSAEDELLESFGELMDSAARKMSHEEFMKTAEKVKAGLDQAIATHSQRRGTA